MVTSLIGTHVPRSERRTDSVLLHITFGPFFLYFFFILAKQLNDFQVGIFERGVTEPKSELISRLDVIGIKPAIVDQKSEG